MSDLITCQFCGGQITENVGRDDRDEKLRTYMEHVDQCHPEVGFVATTENKED